MGNKSRILPFAIQSPAFLRSVHFIVFLLLFFKIIKICLILDEKYSITFFMMKFIFFQFILELSKIIQTSIASLLIDFVCYFECCHRRKETCASHGRKTPSVAHGVPWSQDRGFRGALLPEDILSSICLALWQKEENIL